MLGVVEVAVVTGTVVAGVVAVVAFGRLFLWRSVRREWAGQTDERAEGGRQQRADLSEVGHV